MVCTFENQKSIYLGFECMQISNVLQSTSENRTVQISNGDKPDGYLVQISIGSNDN
jgi:hypothetical protein